MLIRFKFVYEVHSYYLALNDILSFTVDDDVI